MGGIKNYIGKVKESVVLLRQQSLLAIQGKKYGRPFVLVAILKKLNTTVKSLKEQKRQERQTKWEMDSAKDMLSFVALACWQRLMNGRLLTGNA